MKKSSDDNQEPYLIARSFYRVSALLLETT
jgi:hypothetical protein